MVVAVARPQAHPHLSWRWRWRQMEARARHPRLEEGAPTCVVLVGEPHDLVVGPLSVRRVVAHVRREEGVSSRGWNRG
jgi:hypothetical protein